MMSFRNQKCKTSLGLACFRKSKDKLEILLICKRYTYAYNEFIHGKYHPNDTAGLIKLFSGMTMEEKIDILSLNFGQIWYRVWLNSPRHSTYFSDKNKYESTFLVDKGVKLRKLINRSKNSQRVWEMPKGRKRNKNESDLQCAIREFHEETYIPRKCYKIIPDARRKYSYVDDGIRYDNHYYMALMIQDHNTVVNFNCTSQIDEICDIRWMTIEEVKFIDPDKLYNFVLPMFKYVKKYNKIK